MKIRTTRTNHIHELGVTLSPRLSFMSGPAAGPPRIIVSLERIYKNLFKDPDDTSTIDELKAALAEFNPNDPTSRETVDAILVRLNDGHESPFNDAQLTQLKKVLKSDNAISPSNADTNTALAGRRFFHALVFGSVDQVRALWRLLHVYRANPGDANARTHVVDLLNEMVPASAWSDDQLDALCNLAVDDPNHRPLAWWDTAGDAW